MVAPLIVALIEANPCTLLDARDVTRVLGWAVVASAPRTYRMPGGSGEMCTFDGRDGTVIVTIPSKGPGLPDADMTSDLGSMRTPLHDAPGLGAPVDVGRGSAIVHDRGREYGINVQPIDAQFADEPQMRALAAALVAHLASRPHLHPTGA